MNFKIDRDVELGVEIDRVRDTLIEAMDRAADETLPHFRTGTIIDNKDAAGFDPVTRADRDAETAIRDTILARFPDHKIIGEEHGTTGDGSAYSWIIDPVDGTRAFVAGVPVWGTLIGVAHEGRVFAGAMSQPFIGETFLGLPDGATYMRHGESRPISASSVTALDDARLFTTTPSLFLGPKRMAYDRLEAAVKLPRYGCDCYAYCLLAAGQVDLVVEPALNIYDIAALIPIVRAAGGVLTTFDGAAPDRGGDIIAAATPELHAAAMEMMRS